MTLEQRFQAAACDLVAVTQDRAVLQQQCAQLNEKAHACAAAVENGRAVVLALLEATDGTHTFEAVEAAHERARRWLKEV